MVMIIYLDYQLPDNSSDTTRKDQRATSSLPYSVLLQMGFTKPASHLAAGALLPHRSTLTQINWAVFFSIALSLRSPSLDVIQHPALWSPDFPQMSNDTRDHLSYSMLFNLSLICLKVKYNSFYH